ncbi:sigma 54-interacting transcriptional regulator [Desulfovibrio aminophilus]|nr:sigma 54-interacting transcriptional regulator [Desulfovibrio aminophilus]MCM0754572.1 sigma 54-interacting transcriptional regulator [Desulfovibrio aminophilus]
MAIPREAPCEAIMESLADGVFTVDLDWNITFFNRRAAQITGVPQAEAVGRKCWEVFRSSVCDGACVLRSCLESDLPQGVASIYFVRADGDKVPVSVSAAPLKDRKGRVIGGVETFRDLSEVQLLRRKLDGRYSLEDIHGKSSALARALEHLPQIAASGVSVLLLGESGTGKELFARALHNLSARKDGPFVAVNCGALPENLLESELFGYKAGAFTDAKKDKPGRFQAAQGGTLFLDEIGDMPLALQVKLLRVLQEKTFEPLGGTKPLSADVRIVAATNRDLEDMVGRGRFRQDLFYRLNVARIVLPPLRERTEDIPLLTDLFVNRQNLLQGKDVAGPDEDVLRILLSHPFPGNVRELENIIEYAFILCPGGLIRPEHLPEYIRPVAGAVPPPAPGTLEEIKRRAALAAIERHGGKRMAACRELNISKDTLRRILSRTP